jgi:hypothetical protein
MTKSPLVSVSAFNGFEIAMPLLTALNGVEAIWCGKYFSNLVLDGPAPA